MEDNWRHDPFEVHSEDGWLYGRGTTDNKVELMVCPACLQPLHIVPALPFWLLARPPGVPT